MIAAIIIREALLLMIEGKYKELFGFANTVFKFYEIGIGCNLL